MSQDQDMTAAWRVLRLYHWTPEGVAEDLGLPLDEVRAHLSEVGIVDLEDPEPGEGMPGWFARDLALLLGVHRACLEDPDWEMGNEVPALTYDRESSEIDPLYGLIELHVRGPQARFDTPMKLPIFESAVTEWGMPATDRAIAFLSSGMSACVVFADGLDYVSVTGADAGFQDPRGRDPLAGINPELCLGAFELFALAGEEDVLDPAWRGRNPHAMSEIWVQQVQEFIEGYGVEAIRRDLCTVEVFYRDGALRRVELEHDYNTILAGFYRFCADGGMPPFFLGALPYKLSGIPTSRIAVVRLPWPMIALYGAHLGLDLEAEDDEIDEDPAPADDEDIIMATADMLPGKS